LMLGFTGEVEICLSPLKRSIALTTLPSAIALASDQFIM
jgi:hypothetical protein